MHIVFAMFLTSAMLVARWVWWQVSAPWQVAGYYRDNGLSATVGMAVVWLFSLAMLSLWVLAMIASS